MMRFPTEREKRMKEIEPNFINFLIYDKYHDITTAKLKDNAPIKVKEYFNEWNKLYKEQEKEDRNWPFM